MYAHFGERIGFLRVRMTQLHKKEKSMDNESNVLQRRIVISYSKIYVASIYCEQYFVILKEKYFFSHSG